MSYYIIEYFMFLLTLTRSLLPKFFMKGLNHEHIPRLIITEYEFMNKRLMVMNLILISQAKVKLLH